MPNIRLVRTARAATPRAVPVALGEHVPLQAVAAAEAAGFTGAAGQICDARTVVGRMLLIGVGERLTPKAAQAAGAKAAARLADCPHIVLEARGRWPEIAAEFALGAGLRAWRPDAPRARVEEDAPKLQEIDLLVDLPQAARAAWRLAQAELDACLFARALVAAPANVLTPQVFCDRLAGLVQPGLKLEVLDEDELRRQGFGALLAVGGGSAHPPRLAVLRWAGKATAKPKKPLGPLAFVGKGLTFDTGGISIKPANRMWEMRADMAGAAAAAGAVLALARRGSPTPAVAVLALAENTTGATSYRPGDVLRSYSGRTIEVVDTDAEGRLALADALAWTVATLKPRAIIDLATLTGSIVTTLGHHMAGLFDNDPALAAKISTAGSAAEEPVWRMPIAEAHRRDLDSDIADIRHCLTGRLLPDACHAAAFLREFVGKTPWAHLDIAGVEAREDACDRNAAGPTGFGVRLLNRLVQQAFDGAR